jgi:radical SAM enzyme (TIGR01210 family)
LINLISIRKVNPHVYATVAQLVERLTCNQQVGSSNLPSGFTIHEVVDMKRGERRESRPDEPAAVWSEQETLDEKALVVILRTSGCAWARSTGCLMCGYATASLPEGRHADIGAQVGRALERYRGEGCVKLYTSGSFLDSREVPEPEGVLARFFEAGARRVVVETRPEYIAASRELLYSYSGKLEIAIGLETASDRVRERCVRKGFTFAQYAEAARAARDAGCRVRTYLLLKPPFLSEVDALRDTLSSVAAAAAHSDVISVNPVNVQGGTLVERLWRRGEYRPPWLWSVVELLALASGRKGPGVGITGLEPLALRGKLRLVSSPSGGGSQRGTHNCGKCDARVLEAITKFSLTQDRTALEGLCCTCVERWRSLLALEPFAATTINVEKAMRLG